jgi:hypothetical protein
VDALRREEGIQGLAPAAVQLVGDGAADGGVDAQGPVVLGVLVALMAGSWRIYGVDEVGVRYGYIIGPDADDRS